MRNNKCPSCAKAVSSKFNFCPYCGYSFKEAREREDFGLLGRDDGFDGFQFGEIKLPLGLNKLVDSLVKQLEKQMNNVNFGDLPKTMPQGFKIKISTGRLQEDDTKEEKPKIPEKEVKRRVKLPKVDASSKIRRLSDRIVYEIDVPGVKMKKDVELDELASGLEVRAYSKNKCFVKFIPIKGEIINYYLGGGKLFVELKA